MYHIGSFWLFKHSSRKITKCISVYSRPSTSTHLNKENFNAIDIAQVAERSYEISNYSSSNLIEEYEKLYCDANNVKLIQLFCNTTLNGLYDTDNQRLITMYQNSLQEEKNLNIQGFI